MIETFGMISIEFLSRILSVSFLYAKLLQSPLGAKR